MSIPAERISVAHSMDPATTALLLVGFQNEYFSPEGGLRDVLDEPATADAVLATTVGLVTQLAGSGIEVVAANVNFTPGYDEVVDPVGALKTVKDRGALQQGSEGARMVEGLRRVTRGIVEVDSWRGLDAFSNPALAAHLTARGITDVVIAGGLACVCLDATARAAHDLGFRVSVLADATLGRTRSEHELYCSRIFPLYAAVISSAELIGRLAAPGTVSPDRPAVAEQATASRASKEELSILVHVRLLQELQEREHDLSQAQRLAHLGSWSWDMVENQVTWTDELYRIMWVTRETFEPSYEGFIAKVHPEDRDRVERIVAGAAASHAAFSYRCRTAPAIGARWLQARGEVHLDGTGQAVRMHGTLQALGEGDAAAATEAAAATPTSADEVALRMALDEGRLVLHYQPKISLETDRITGAEALVRWEDPERGLLPPLEFIPLAEQTGLIVPIGRWIIGEVCRQVAHWNRHHPSPPIILSANVSGLQLSSDLVEVVARALRESGAAPSHLCLEVTESSLIDDADGAIVTLRALAGLGVKLSIDDFGTGYSSLSYLKRLPLHELKIDKSFVDGLGDGPLHDPDDTAIVAATIAMAHALDLSVVAEGIERPEQLARLRVLGCQEAQGYLFSRPVPAAQMEELLDAPTVSWASPSAAPSGSGGPGRILIVDDADDVRQLARITLAAAGFEVYEAANGAEALTLAGGLQPDCVILDVSMPGMSGMEVCRQLRDDPATAACTILMLTSNAAADDKVEAFSGGADDYIIKPFSPRDLVTRVRAAMGRATSTMLRGTA